MNTGNVSISAMGRNISQGVTALQEQATILDQEIFDLMVQLQKIQNQINAKQAQRDACLGVASEFLNYRSEQCVYGKPRINN